MASSHPDDPIVEQVEELLALCVLCMLLASSINQQIAGRVIMGLEDIPKSGTLGRRLLLPVAGLVERRMMLPRTLPSRLFLRHTLSPGPPLVPSSSLSMTFLIDFGIIFMEAGWCLSSPKMILQVEKSFACSVIVTMAMQVSHPRIHKSKE
jgi:hypothetical protein